MDDTPDLHDGDLVIPADVYRLFLQGRITWRQLLEHAVMYDQEAHGA